jgi:hypothetical protein
MPIEFRCTSCQQQLRVPDESAGRNAKCPKCGAVAVVPSASVAPLSGYSPLSQPLPSSPFAEAAKPPGGSPLGTNPGMGSNPFGQAAGGAGGAAGGFAPGGGSPNPYASPQAINYQPQMGVSHVPITNVPVGVEQVFNYAWQIWQVNLGLLVGTTFVFFVIIYGFGFLLGGFQAVLESNDSPELSAVVAVIGNIASNLIQLFLGVGQTLIALKLARRQQADFSDLFAGGPRFLPMLGAYILLMLAISTGLLLLIVPGIIIALMWWPVYYLVVDGKAGVIESFSVASHVTKNNWGTALVLYLLSIGIVILGCMALCIGLLFAFPLFSLLFAVAYLMMSGQLSPYGQIPGQMLPGQFAPQPMPGKF